MSRKPSSQYSKIPIAQATAGKLYRVRDKDWVKVWGRNLPWAEANQLKESVVGARKSKTARVEDEAIPPPDWYVEPSATPTSDDESGDVSDLMIGTELTQDLTKIYPGAVAQPDGSTVVPAPGMGAAFEVDSLEPILVPARGVVFRVPPGFELIVNGEVASMPRVVAPPDLVHIRALDPALAQARMAALAAARGVAAAAQARADGHRYRDKTVKAPVPRTKPAPPDKTISKDPVLVRLGAPPTGAPEPPKSPLKAAIELDGEPLPPDALTDTDLPDLAGDLGGGESEADVAEAKRRRDAEALARSRGNSTP